MQFFCKFINNFASRGGGTYEGILYNCVLAHNVASLQGGGAAGNATLYNCTLTSNSAHYCGGGTYGGALNNCINYYNTAPDGANYYDATLNYCCTTPDPGGTNNITNEPQFVNAAAGDYRLLPSSPCIDRGINQDWMYEETDLAGHPRILNGAVDMGAYEFYFEGNFKVWLQGPYQTNAHGMTTALNVASNIPLTSPYADDPREVSAIPSNATDWVLLQLRKSTNSAPFVSQSVFLSEEGTLLSDNGATNLLLEASTGTYYAVVKHRNHVAAMSAEPVAFTNQRVSYDFTTNAAQFYGGTNGAVRLESNAWGMIAGDADGDGEILGVDAFLYDTQTNSMGYKRADFNLDGVVSNEDREVFWNRNQGRRAAMSQGETILKPALKLHPSRKTLLSGSTNLFCASGGTGTIHWACVKNPSGGTYIPTPPTSIVYRAGTVSSCIDVLEAWDGEGQLGRAYVNVIHSNDIASAGKAIILAGRAKDDSVWPTTDYLADLAFNTLLYRGYGKERIHYLSSVVNQDVDGNGELDDIDLETTWAHAAFTFTNWAIRTDRLFVYLVDHGGTSSEGGYFQLNDSERLMATNLGAWLDELQNTYTTKVTVLIDCCYAGSLLEKLAYTGTAQRIVIAACGTKELTYFVAGGLVSFSDAFFGGVMRGDTVEQAWLAASNTMESYQKAVWKDTGGGNLASDPLGASFVAGKDIPQIGSVCGNQLLFKTTAATLWAGDIVSVYPIERVWCLVMPPRHRPSSEDPVTDLPERDLSYESRSGRYQARYEGFSEKGDYKALFYAQDVWGSVSPPRQSYVKQSGYDERVILAVGGPTNSVSWVRYNHLARYAYHTFQARWLNPESIYYLGAETNQDVNADGTNDVDAVISLANLASAITNWAGPVDGAGPADALTVYLIGEGGNQIFRLNETEVLDAPHLNSWLKAFLGLNEKAKINVIMDFSESGRFIPDLAASNRVCVASCGAEQGAVCVNEGVVSFSWYFLNRIFQGFPLYEAFLGAEEGIYKAARKRQSDQEAQLDDDGDGKYNQDGTLVAGSRYIGAAFVTGAQTLTIGEVTPDTALKGVHALGLWASHVTAMEGISNVFCLITPPDWDGSRDLPATNLVWNHTANRYEALYSFSEPGKYTLTFHAVDKKGEISYPRQAEVMVSDAYEPDNAFSEAQAVEVGETQAHDLHESHDEDWVKFYAFSNYTYEIETVQQGTNVDTVLDVYYEQLDGGKIPIVTNVNRRGKGVGTREWAELSNPVSGMYYVRVRSADSNAWGIASDYQLTVKVSVGSGDLVVIVVDKLHSGQSPVGAVVVVDGTARYVLNGAPTLTLVGLESGIHTIKVSSAEGYLLEEDPAQPGQIENPNSYLYGNPKAARVEEGNWRCAVFQFIPVCSGLYRQRRSGRVDG